MEQASVVSIVGQLVFHGHRYHGRASSPFVHRVRAQKEVREAGNCDDRRNAAKCAVILEGCCWQRTCLVEKNADQLELICCKRRNSRRTNCKAMRWLVLWVQRRQYKLPIVVEITKFNSVLHDIQYSLYCGKI